MDIKEESPVDVPGSHLPEVSFIPTDPCRLRHSVEPGPSCHYHDPSKDGPPVGPLGVGGQHDTHLTRHDGQHWPVMERDKSLATRVTWVTGALLST